MKPRGIETRSLRHRALLVVALALILGRACPGAAAGNVSLAVMDFQVNGFSDYLGGAVAEMLRTGFVGLPGIDILERAQIDAIAREHKLNLSGLVETRTAVSLGKLIGAHYVILGAVNKIGSMAVITARIVSVSSGTSIRGFERQSPSGESGIFQATSALREDILEVLAPGATSPSAKGTAGRPQPPQVTPAQSQMSSSPEGTLAGTGSGYPATNEEFLSGAVSKYVPSERNWSEGSKELIFWMRYEPFPRESRKDAFFAVAADAAIAGGNFFPGVALNNGAQDVGFYLDGSGNVHIFVSSGKALKERRFFPVKAPFPAALQLIYSTTEEIFDFQVNGVSVAQLRPENDLNVQPFSSVRQGASMAGHPGNGPLSPIQVSYPTISSSR
jgi:TolB-like protein